MARKNFKKEKDLENLVEVLTKENNNLKKKIGKLRKLAEINNLLEEDEYAETSYKDVDEDPESKKMIKTCAKCKGEVKEIKVLNVLFSICQKCKNRIKLLPKK